MSTPTETPTSVSSTPPLSDNRPAEGSSNETHGDVAQGDVVRGDVTPGGFTMLGDAGTACEGDACLI